MTLDDIPTVAQIEREVFSLPWSSTAFRYEVEHNVASQYLTLRYTPWARLPQQETWLGPVRRLLRRPTGDPSLLGYGGCWLMVDEAHISTLAVRADWRGRGLGELLLASLIEVAYEREARVATLEVRVSNTVAQCLYSKYGFRQAGRRKAYYSDNREDAFILTTDEIMSPLYRSRFEELTSSLRQRLLAAAQEPPSVSPPSEEAPTPRGHAE